MTSKIQWVPVAEGLPEGCTYVLMCGRDADLDDGPWRSAGIYLGDGRWHDDYGDSLHPTHWMPLPEPPEELT